MKASPHSVLLLVVAPVVGQEADLDVPVLVVGLSQELADGLPLGLQKCESSEILTSILKQEGNGPIDSRAIGQ